MDSGWLIFYVFVVVLAIALWKESLPKQDAVALLENDGQVHDERDAMGGDAASSEGGSCARVSPVQPMCGLLMEKVNKLARVTVTAACMALCACVFLSSDCFYQRPTPPASSAAQLLSGGGLPMPALGPTAQQLLQKVMQTLAVQPLAP